MVRPDPTPATAPLRRPVPRKLPDPARARARPRLITGAVDEPDHMEPWAGSPGVDRPSGTMCAGDARAAGRGTAWCWRCPSRGRRHQPAARGGRGRAGAARARADLPLSGPGAAVLTTLPVLCFGLLATAAPRLARRFGIEPVLVGVMAALAAAGPDPRPGRRAGPVRRHRRRRRGDRGRERPAAAADQARLPGPYGPDDGRLHDGGERGRRRGGRARGSAGRRAGLGWRGALGVWALPAASRRSPGCPGRAGAPDRRRRHRRARRCCATRWPGS